MNYLRTAPHFNPITVTSSARKTRYKSDSHELTHTEFTPKMKRGWAKLNRLSVDGMVMVKREFERRTGMNPYNIYNKRAYLHFVDDYIKNYRRK